MAQKRILVVDDELNILTLQRLILSAEGYAVSAVLDGREALDYIANMTPDLVMLDISLPGMDGYEVCRNIKSNEASRHTPVVMVSARDSEEDIKRARQAGADSYITKPFKSSRYLEVVQSFLSHKSTRHPVEAE